MENYAIILSQSNFVHKDSLSFPMEERGLQFGDGVYEVIRVYEGKPYLLDAHIERLYRSLVAVQIQIDETFEEMKDFLLTLIEKNNMKNDGAIYLQVTRGSAKRNHLYPMNTPANMFAYLYDQPRNLDILESGVSVITLPDERWDNCFIKSLNLLPNVMAKQSATEQGSYEAMLHKDGVVTECSSANVYLVRNGTIYTHPATNRILYGCVRMAVEQFASELGIPIIEEAFTLSDIQHAEEMFLTSSSSEVLAITKVNDQIIADGNRGEITTQLLHAYERDADLIAKKVN